MCPYLCSFDSVPVAGSPHLRRQRGRAERRGVREGAGTLEDTRGSVEACGCMQGSVLIEMFPKIPKSESVLRQSDS